MANTIDIAFITQYLAEAHVAYQQFGSKISNTVRRKRIVPGEAAVFQVYGKGTATDKARNGDIVPMNPVHSVKNVTMTDKYAPELIDKLDELKTNIDERQLAVRTGVGALGRYSDGLITTAMDAVTTNVVATGATGLSKGKLLQSIEKLNSYDVPDDGDRWGVVSSLAWEEFINIAQVSSRDYVDNLTWAKGTSVVRWRNINWFFSSILPKSGNSRSNFLYHRTAVGFCENAELQTIIDWVPMKASYLVNSFLSAGAVVLDEEGIVKIVTDESVTTLLA